MRTRHGVQAEGDVGGDLPRIELQQAFMSSVIQKVNSQGILSNSVQLLKIADVATRALTVDQGLDSVSKLLGLAKSLTGLHAKNVSLLTMLTITDPADVNRLLPEEPADDVIFQMILDGQTWHHRLPTRPYGQVQVRVLNGTATPGLAAQTARRLTRLGFHVTGTGDAAATAATTVTYSGTAQADSAYTLTTGLTSAPAAQNLLAEPARQTGQPGAVTLVIGTNFAGVNAPAAAHRAGGTGKGKAAGGGTGSASPVSRPPCRAATPAPASAPACPRRTPTPAVPEPPGPGAP